MIDRMMVQKNAKRGQFRDDIDYLEVQEQMNGWALFFAALRKTN